MWLPVEQWRRDGRLVHGLRRGAASFTARTAVAALDITTRLLQLIQASTLYTSNGYPRPGVAPSGTVAARWVARRGKSDTIID